MHFSCKKIQILRILDIYISISISLKEKCTETMVLDMFSMQPPAQGRVDPAVLASLPPSMQLDLLVQV